MYTLGRILKVGGRPVMFPDPLNPSFRANVEQLGPFFLNFEPHICDVHTWEDPKSWWPASNVA